VRAYLSARDPEPCPCVSTRGAELTVVLEGEVAIEVGPARQTVRVQQGEAVWVPRGLAHAVIVSTDARAFIVDEAASIGELGFHHVPGSQMPASVLRRFDMAWTRRPDTALARIADATSELVARVKAGSAISVESSSSTPKMLAAKRIIEACFIRPPTLAEVAKTVGTSEFYLLRNFKRHFTFTPYAYAQFLRTEHFFWELLEADDRRLADIASDSGFGDYSTFHRRMRAMTGVAPSHLVDASAGDVLGPG
jgi:AraC-like DNA-binding protein